LFKILFLFEDVALCYSIHSQSISGGSDLFLNVTLIKISSVVPEYFAENTSIGFAPRLQDANRDFECKVPSAGIIV
jgi:hypothetical protein